MIVILQPLSLRNTLNTMQLEKVRTAFEKKGFPQNSFIDKRECFRILNTLTPGGDFHEQVAQELWTQAVGQQPSHQVRIKDLCNTIVDAQNILKTRLAENQEEIMALQSQKRKLQSNPTRDSIRKIQQIDQRLDELYEQKQSFEDDYRLVSQPFGIQMIRSIIKNQYQSTPDYGNDSYRHHDKLEAYPSERYEGHVESEELKFLLYLTLAFGFIEIIVIYGKYDFLNLIVLTSLLSIYLLNFFDRIYIRFTLVLIAVSIVLDFLWMILYAGQKWNPPEIGNDSIYQIGYLRFIVFFTAVLLVVKCALGFYLFKHRHTDSQDKYVVSLGLVKIMLNANRSNPISKGITNNFTALA